MPNALRPYLEHQELEPQPGSEHKLWVGPQSDKGLFSEPSATRAIMVTARASPDAQRTQHDNEEFSAVRSARAKIQGVYPEIAFDCECYLQPDGDLDSAVTLDAGDNPPQADHILRQVWGSVRLVDGQTLRTITAVTTADQDTTVFTLGGGVGTLAVNDMIELVTHEDNEDYSGPANGEVRRVTNVNGLIITVVPGFSRRPLIAADISGAADSIQGVRVYEPTRRWESWLSARALEGSIGKQLVDGKAGSFEIAFSPEEPLKIKFGLMFLSMVRAGIDMVTGESGGDSFLSTDTELDVMDASKFELDSYVDLLVVDCDPTSPTYDTILSTEPAARVADRDLTTTPHTLTLVRGGAVLAAATDTQAEALAYEKPGPYNTATKKWLKFRVDRGQWVTFNATLPTAPVVPDNPTATEVALNLNHQLARHKYYGFNPGGRTAVTWGDVFANNAGSLAMVSKCYGSQSQVEVAIADVAATSLHDVLFDSVFDVRATEEVQVVPHEPATTELGTEVHGYTALLCWGSYILGINSVTVSGSNNPRVLREMKRTPWAFGIIPGKTRTFDISCELLQRSDAAAFVEDEKSRVQRVLNIQTCGTKGEIVGINFPLARILTVTTGGDDEVTTMSMTIGVEGSATGDDEAVFYTG